MSQQLFTRRSDNYWKKLKNHPGVLPAALMSMFGVLVAVEKGILPALPVIIVWWIPVLITARTQPLPEDQ